jgi:hypothetical protein
VAPCAANGRHSIGLAGDGAVQCLRYFHELVPLIGYYVMRSPLSVLGRRCRHPRKTGFRAEHGA